MSRKPDTVHQLHPKAFHIQPKNERQDQLLRAIEAADFTIAMGSAGTGKAVPLDTKVLTPTGWKQIGALKVGDVITATDSSTQIVTGVYPQGLTDCYKITFKDGRTALCSSDHLWEVFHYDHSEGIVKSLKEILKLKCFKRLGLRLFEKQAEEVALPLDPYLLGLVLGDGGLTTDSVMFSSKDKELIDSFKPNFEVVTTSSPIDYRIKGLYSVIRSLGLEKTNSYTKFIPDQYLTGSLEQRWSLLQGLLDTDGTADRNGHISFQVSNFKLASQVQELVWSLGGLCKLTERKVLFTYKGEKKLGKPAWRLSIRFNDPTKAFRLQRKKVRTENYQYAGKLKLRFQKVEKVKDTETVCISVSNPNQLFVLENYVVTHNTYCAVSKALNLLLQRKARRIVMSRPNVPTGRSLGFFPGDIKEKLEPWLAPMLSVVKTHMGTEWYDNQFRRGNLQIQPIETIRGASFDDSVILIDEAQNLNLEEIKAISTRIGTNSKLILMGDPDQRDIRQSDLTTMANLYERSGLFIPVIRFGIDDIVRSDIVADLVKLYYKEGI